MHKITIKNLTKIYGNNPKQALELLHKGLSNEEIRRRTRQVVGVKQVDFSVAAGESFVIMGLSGSGKSTLLRCLNRLIEATSGEIIIDGENITELPIKELTQLRRKKIAMVFQHFALLPHRTILDNVAYGLEVDKIPKPQRNARALEILELVGLKEWADYRPDNLSGGMQQRVGIARALTTDPDILLMDEPFSALDPLIRQEMQDELMVLQRKLQKTIVFITHDLDEALKIGDRVALMKDGEIVQIGSPEDILLSPATDYVARFVENVDRAKALMAASVMVKARSIVYPKDGPLVALRTMEKYGMSTLFVTNRGGKIIGYIRAEDAAEEANKGERQLDAIIQRDMPLTAPETPLRDLLEVIAHTKVPVAVVNEKEILVGVLVRGSVIAGLAGEGRELA